MRHQQTNTTYAADIRASTSLTLFSFLIFPSSQSYELRDHSTGLVANSVQLRITAMKQCLAVGACGLWRTSVIRLSTRHKQ
ncbi:hypothetical protein EDB81DRAFT_796453 [Dactylonectria macrodidyma]|uniref:Uncharacterized protein n=1 Tax=Dactylonectria macrodidyma TaxID=307937 RepID=A0A9P9J4M6_9HYPO|nr:hypothetical protein EDB81DRAFT_796453 [Dactylonectria macrodidyma]